MLFSIDGADAENFNLDSGSSVQFTADKGNYVSITPQESSSSYNISPSQWGSVVNQDTEVSFTTVAVTHYIRILIETEDGNMSKDPTVYVTIKSEQVSGTLVKYNGYWMWGSISSFLWGTSYNYTVSLSGYGTVTDSWVLQQARPNVILKLI